MDGVKITIAKTKKNYDYKTSQELQYRYPTINRQALKIITLFSSSKFIDYFYSVKVIIKS